MKFQRALLGFTLLAMTSVALFLLNSCGTFSGNVMSPPQIPGATFVGNKVCADCHAPQFKTFPAAVHARVHLVQTNVMGGTSCENCHGPGSEHVKAGAGRKFILNPGKNPSACFECHLDTHAEFNFPQHHPVLEGKMNCIQCHDPHGRDILKPSGGLAMARVNESCAQCHREQTKPVVFEHEAMREGCTVCHSPHGSINKKMLTQQDPNLCLRCHAQNPGIFAGTGQIYIGVTDHTDKLRQGTCWTSGCHTAVHGSNVDVQLKY